MVRVVTPGQGVGAQCSGVCVSAAGLVLTAKHCRPGAETRVWFGEADYAARVIFEPRTAEGAVVLQVEAPHDLPFLPVARAAPSPGEPVVSLGFPAGQWSRNEGTVTRLFTMEGLPMIETGFRVLGGNSGGPLLDREGRVAGIASARALFPGELRYESLRRGIPYDPRQARPASYWIAAEALHSALEAARGTPGTTGPRKRLYVFTEPRLCAPCRQFAADRTENKGGLGAIVARFDLCEVRRTPLGWDPPPAARAFEQRFRRIAETPTFWIEGAPQYLRGYPAADGRQRLTDYLTAYGAEAAAEGSPGRDAAPKLDWADVTFVLLVAEQEAGGALRRGALRLGAGPLERRIAAATGGKARLMIVAERTGPARFTAVQEAAGVEADPLYLLVLVARHDLGVKGLVAGPVEKIVAGRLEDTPVDLVFERVHRRDYEAILAALAVPEAEGAGERPAGGGGLADGLGERLDRLHAAVETVRGAVERDRGRNEKGSGPEVPLDRLAVGAVAAWTTERLRLLAKLRWMAGRIMETWRRDPA